MRLVDANNTRPLSWGGGGGVTNGKDPKKDLFELHSDCHFYETHTLYKEKAIIELIQN